MRSHYTIGVMIETALVVTTALLLDRWLGEFRRLHPLVGFGQVGRRVEKILFRGTEHSTRVCGVVGWVAMVFPTLVVALLLLHLEGFFHLLAEVVGLYLVIGGRSLAIHATAVEQALKNRDLSLAQERVGWMVSRECETLDEQKVASATIESVLENGNDALFAALFWFIVAGLPGALVYRAVNTLDAMWGYKNDRYDQYGWFAAHADDWMNWLPARLTAMSYLLIGKSLSALQSWRTQAHQCKSPNAGVVMATGAGALEIELGGSAWYHGRLEERPQLGCCRKPFVGDIDRSVALIEHSVLLWVVLIWGVGLFNG